MVHSPEDAANLLQGEMSILEQEHLKAILLDTKNGYSWHGQAW